MFVGRKDELSAIEKYYKSSKAEFIVLYGRRRVGKTELIHKFGSEKRNFLYMLGTEETEKDQALRFSAILSLFWGDPVLETNPLNNFRAVLTYLLEKCRQQKLVIVLDEFPFMVKANKALPSILQQLWDEGFQKTKALLILSGSSIAMMEKKVLGHKSPLYGRRTAQILLEPFNFFDAVRFFSHLKPVEQVKFYSVLGGTPAYLLCFSKKLSLADNIFNNVLQKDSFLYNDVSFLLKEELPESRFYLSILKAISFGKTKLGEIINETGLNKGIVSKYISVLIDLHLIERKIPITETKPAKSRKGIYVLKDNYFAFWFRFIHPYQDMLEMGRNDEVLKLILRDLGIFTSFIFEEICRKYLVKNMQKLPFVPMRIGSFWDKNEEIDVAAVSLDGKEILLGECKWSRKPIGASILKKLEEKALKIHEKYSKYYYSLFSKSGFTSELKQEAKKRKDLFLFSLKEIVK